MNCSVNICLKNFIVNINPQAPSQVRSVEEEFDSVMENYDFGQY